MSVELHFSGILFSFLILALRLIIEIIVLIILISADRIQMI